MALNDFATHFVVDRWIALSSLQKSIRRGAIEPATTAAEFLWSEPSRLLDRLLVIGLGTSASVNSEVLRESLNSLRTEPGDAGAGRGGR